MLLRPFLYDKTACASYLFGCGTQSRLAVVDPHVELVDDYLATAAALGAPIVAAFETHVQADHVSGLPALVERSGATAYLPAGAGVEFEHVALADADTVELGNTFVTAIATPGHAPAHHAYTVPYPSHYAGSVCGRGLSGNPVSTVGFERAHNPMLALAGADEFANALLADTPMRPAEQERIVATNRAGDTVVRA